MIKTLTERITPYQALLFVALILSVLLARSFHQPIGDFGNYYFGSRFLLEGRFNTSVYEPWLFNLDIYSQGYRDLFLCYTPVPPFSALVYIPFAWLDLLLAKVLWNAVNMIFFLVTLFRLMQLKGEKFLAPKYILLIPILFFIPIRNTLFSGQSYFLIGFLLTEGYIAYRQDRKWLMGLCWGLSVMLKIFPAVLILFLLFNKDLKGVLWFLLSLMFLFLLSLLFIDLQVWTHYFTYVLPRLAKGEINNTYAQSYQSFQVMLRHLFVPDAMHNPDAPFNNLFLNNLFQKVFLGIILAGIGCACTSSRISSLSKFSLCIAGGILLSGYGTSYGLVLLLFPAIAIMLQGAHSMRPFLLIAVFFICNIPVHDFSQLPFLLQYPRFYLLLLLFSAYLFVLRPELNLRLIVLLIALPLLTLLLPSPTDNDSRYWLKKEEALLIYDFQVSIDSIEISCFDSKGPWKKKIATDERILSAVPCHLVKPGENILKALIIDHKQIVYLSDKNRGVGFYTLRVMANQ